jgi:proteasome lid subunit RPN8/RPN11
LSVPSQARQVQAFVLPPEPLPTNLYGRRPERFFFTDLEGAAVGQQQMEGHTSVLVWFTAHPACRPALEQLDQLRLKMADNPKMRFYAVCTEPSTMSNDRLRELGQQWKVDVPLLRDLEACGRDVFQIPGAPTLVVLDPKGAVQVFEAGTDSALIEQLPEVLRRLDQGQDLAAQLLAAYRVEQENYQRLLEAGGGTQSTVLEMPKTQVRPASQPQHLKLRELWACDQVTAAGNLLVVSASHPVAAQKTTGEAEKTTGGEGQNTDGSDGDRAGEKAGDDKILVLDGFQTVVELSSKGEVLRRATLQLPRNSAVTYLRTAADGQGKRYYAAASLRGPQVHLFDQQWNHLFDYPSLDQPHEGVHDSRLADLDGDGQVELYAGFWGLVGIHAIDFQGQRKWSNRTATNVLTLAVSTPNAVGWRKLLASSDLGPITRINQFGIDDKPIEVPNRAIHHLYSWEGEAEGLPPYCGLSYQGPGNMVAVGLDEDFAEQWNYAMPAGTYETEIQFVTTLYLPGNRRAWALAGPDGSVHLVGADGQFSDHFGTGQSLTGIAGAVWQGRPILLLATSKRITAWELLP